MSKRKLAYTLSAVALLAGAGAFGPMAWAEGEDCVAANLEELQVCLAGEGETIATTATITVSGEGNNVVLVTNGKTINGAAGLDMFIVEDGAELTFRGNGTINAGRYFAVADGAKLIIDGPNINATNNASYGVYAKDNGRVTMESGMVTADYAAFAGNNTTGDMNFYIEGGILKSNRYPAIYMPGQVDLRIRGGTIDGGIVARMGQIEVEGGTINQQANPVAGDGIDQNYSSMPSVANEAITLLAGSYKSDNAEYGNAMNVEITGGQINSDIVLYDLGNTATGYEQNVNVEIWDGTLTGFKTKFTEEEIGFALKSGYTAGLNNDAGRINVEIWGGEYTVEPDEADIAPGHEPELNTETGTYEIWPINVEYGDWYIEDGGAADGHASVTVEFGNSLIADRKATLSAVVLENTEGLSLDETKGGDLIGAVEIDMLDRDGALIEVKDNSLVIWFDIDEDTYNMLSAYDKLYAVYFDENGVEAERYEITLENEGFWFETSHLSTYGVVGVNGGAEAEQNAAGTSSAATPDTGTVTVAGASAMSAAIITAVAVGLLTSIVSFAYLIRKH